MDYPKDIINVLNTLEENGFEAYLVGGSVRDFLLKKECHDYDIATSALPEQVMNLFENCQPTGIEQGTVTIYCEHPVEVTTFRIESDYQDHRHPSHVEFVLSIEQDLARRDFTVNAMAYSPKRGLIDPFNGQQDLEKRVIRCVNDASLRFQEDAFRMMRAHRFVAQLGFSMDPLTYMAIQNNKHLLTYISIERIRDELLQILKYNPYEIENMVDLLEPWIPELKLSLNCPQNTKWHYCNVLHHCLRAVKEMNKFDETLAWVLLFHDLGKPMCRVTDKNGVDHFKGHPEVSCEISKRLVKTLKLTAFQQQWIPELVLNHENWLYPRLETVHNLRIEMAWTDQQVRQLLEVRRCDILAHSLQGQKTMIQILAFRDLYEKCILTRPMSLKTLCINGQDILENTSLTGKEINEMLMKCLDYAFYNPYRNKKKILLEYVKNASLK